jgi:DNA invertase Pin-like site-specific DNA recombinase
MGGVSTRDQNPDSQAYALRTAGCDEIFIDKTSGKLARRPQLDKALLVARAVGVGKLPHVGPAVGRCTD